MAKFKGDIIFLTDNIGDEERQKAQMFVAITNNMIEQYFDVRRTIFETERL